MLAALPNSLILICKKGNCLVIHGLITSTLITIFFVFVFGKINVNIMMAFNGTILFL